MVPWAFVVDNLKLTIDKVKEDGGLGEPDDPLSMREITAMGEYNLARSRNLFGSLKNAYDQRRIENRHVPAHMMPDYKTWLKHARPDVHYHLYGPDPLPPEPRVRDTRGLAERRANRQVVVAERVDSKMPPVDGQGRIRHHHTYEEPPGKSYRHKAGGLHERRQHLIKPAAPTADRSDKAKEMADKAAEAAEKRRRASRAS